MKVMILSNGELEVKEIENTLEELQKIVGGYIEFPYLSETFRKNIIDVIINEEGKYIEGLKPEIAIVDKKAITILDVVYGNCIFASHDAEGNTIGLNDRQIEIIVEELETEMELLSTKTLENFSVRALYI